MATPQEKTTSPEAPVGLTDSGDSGARPASASAADTTTGAGAAGGLGPAPKTGPKGFPEQPVRPPGLEEQHEKLDKLVKPPYATEVAPEGSF